MKVIRSRVICYKDKNKSSNENSIEVVRRVYIYCTNSRGDFFHHQHYEVSRTLTGALLMYIRRYTDNDGNLHCSIGPAFVESTYDTYTGKQSLSAWYFDHGKFLRGIFNNNDLQKYLKFKAFL